MNARFQTTMGQGPVVNAPTSFDNAPEKRSYLRKTGFQARA